MCLYQDMETIIGTFGGTLIVTLMLNWQTVENNSLVAGHWKPYDARVVLLERFGCMHT